MGVTQKPESPGKPGRFRSDECIHAAEIVAYLRLCGGHFRSQRRECVEVPVYRGRWAGTAAVAPKVRLRTGLSRARVFLLAIIAVGITSCAGGNDATHDYSSSESKSGSPGPELQPLSPGEQRALYEKVSPSVVRVVAHGCRDGLATGFFVSESLVMTAAHAVAGRSAIDIMLDTNQAFRATVRVVDPRLDVAVLEAVGVEGPPLPISGVRTVGGYASIVFARSVDRDRTIGHGVASDEYQTPRADIYNSGWVEVLTMDLLISTSPGDSGSPVVDPAGSVIGMVTHGSPTGGGARATGATHLRGALGALLNSEPSTDPVPRLACPRD